MGTAIAGAAVFGIFFAQSGNVFAIISEVLPRRARGVAQGINGVGGNLGAIMGTLTASGFITNYAPDMG
jgi:MFS family permease